MKSYTVEHDFNGHEVNGIHEVNGKKCYYRAFHLLNKLDDFTGILELNGIFCSDDFFRKSHARLYIAACCTVVPTSCYFHSFS